MAWLILQPKNVRGRSLFRRHRPTDITIREVTKAGELSLRAPPALTQEDETERSVGARPRLANMSLPAKRPHQLRRAFFRPRKALASGAWDANSAPERKKMASTRQPRHFSLKRPQVKSTFF